MNKPKNLKTKLQYLKFIKNLKFNIKIRPAVTKVLLWTRALTGVGALIALGNHLLKGNWALFVKPVNKTIRKKNQ